MVQTLVHSSSKCLLILRCAQTLAEACGDSSTDKASFRFIATRCEEARYSEACVAQIWQRQSGMHRGNHSLEQFMDEGAALGCAVRAELCGAVEDQIFVSG